LFGELWEEVVLQYSKIESWPSSGFTEGKYEESQVTIADLLAEISEHEAGVLASSCFQNSLQRWPGSFLSSFAKVRI
jgi:hypothetical protein